MAVGLVAFLNALATHATAVWDFLRAVGLPEKSPLLGRYPFVSRMGAVAAACLGLVWAFAEPFSVVTSCLVLFLAAIAGVLALAYLSIFVHDLRDRPNEKLKRSLAGLWLSKQLKEMREKKGLTAVLNKFHRIRDDIWSDPAQGLAQMAVAAAIACVAFGSTGVVSTAARTVFPKEEDLAIGPVSEEVQAAIENHFKLAPSGKPLPPIPISVGESGEIFYTDYLDRLTSHGFNKLYFVAGPAGSGKSVIRKRIVEEASKRGAGLAVLRLSELPSTERGSRKIGTLVGLPEVDSLLESSPGLVHWFAEVAAQKVCPNDDRFAEYKKAAYQWLLSTRASNSGLILLVDDVDEVGPKSLKNLVRLAGNDLKASVKGHGKEAIILLGRAEVLRFASRQLDNLNEQRALEVASVQRMRLEDFYFQKYIDNCFEYALSTYPTSVTTKTRTLYDRAKESSAFVETLCFVESANFAVSILADKFAKSGMPFSEGAFVDEFCRRWWKRAETSHGVPPHENAFEYRQDIKQAVQYLPGNGKSISLDEHTIPLLLSGFVEVLPCRSFKPAFEIRLQFECTRSYLMNVGQS